MEESAADIAKGAVDPETVYTKQNCIGGGSFGKVYKGVDKRTGEAVAIKIVEIEAANDDVRDIIEEISILAGLHSPYVTKYHGSYLKGSDLWIIMEFCGGGSCADLLESGSISEEYIAIIMKELLMGLDYLHSDKKLHRDIKAANILLGSNGQVKLADFGVSGQLTATMTKKNTFVGTPFWMAPEVIRQSGYNYSADIWSLGITAIELARGRPPHFDIHPMKVLFIIPKQPPPVLDGEFSPVFKDFVALCLRKDPRERPSAKELLKHPFIRKARRPVFLTELIERHERWQARHGSSTEQQNEDEDEPSRTRSKEEEEDLWDFGTIKPAQGRTCGLRVMNEASMNARSTVSRSPSPAKAARNRVMTDVEKKQTPPRGIFNLQMPPAIPSPSRLSPKSEIPRPRSPLSPGAASRFPLPPSPMKPQDRALGRTQAETQQNLQRRPVPPPLSLQTPRQNSHVGYNQSLERSMGGISLATTDSSGGRPSSSHIQPLPPSTMLSQQSQSPSRPQTQHRIELSIPQSQLPRPQRNPSNIPPPPLARTPSSVAFQSFPTPPLSSSQPPTPILQHQQPMPAYMGPPRHQNSPIMSASQIPQPMTTSSGPRSVSGSSLSSTSSSCTTSPLPQPSDSNPPDDMTALTGVIVPALQAAVNRRQYNLNLLHRQSMIASTSSASSTGSGYSPDAIELRRRHLQGQENISRLVGKVSRLFKEIDKWDSWAPVGMGHDVGSFLEGLLEEVLVRVEEVDVEEGGGQR